MRLLTKPTIIVLGIVLVLITAGCPTDALNVKMMGSIKLSISNNIKSRGFGPSIPMEIDHYSISGNRPKSEDTFYYTNRDGDSFVIANLNPGEWEVTVTGYNSENIAIGKGIAFVTVIAGITKNVPILVEEIGGKGDFTLNLVLPTGNDVYEIESVDLTLLQEDKDPISYSSLTLTDGSITLEGLQSGFYTLTIILNNGELGGIWGTAESLRIVQGQETIGTLSLTSEELSRWGGLDLTIVDGMPVNFTVSLAADKNIVSNSQSVTFTATPSLSEGNYTYWWFINGQRLEGNNSHKVTLSQELGLGLHNISVVAIRSGVMASATKKINKTDDPTDGVIINDVFLGTEEVAQILIDLDVDALPNEPGIIFLAPHAIDSPLSGGLLPYSYEITVEDSGIILSEIQIGPGVFATFIPLDLYSDQGSTITLKIIHYDDGSYVDTVHQQIVIPESGPIISWLDQASLFGSSYYLRSVKTIGVRFSIISTLPLTNTNGGPLSASDFSAIGGYVDSVESAEFVGGSLYFYEIIVKSDYDGPDEFFFLSTYTTPNILVDGKRGLGVRKVGTHYLTKLEIPQLVGGEYLDMEDNILEDGYYDFSPEFKVSVDEGYIFAGWSNSANSVSFKNIVEPVWKREMQFQGTDTLPIPIIVSEGTPIVTAFYFDRYSKIEDIDFSVSGPLGSTEKVKLEFSEAVKSSDGSSLSESNFSVEGAAISSVTHNGDYIELMLEEFQKGLFSLELKDVISSNGDKPVAGQNKLESQIVQLQVDNDGNKGSISDCKGLYLVGDEISVTVRPNSNYRVIRLHFPWGYDNSASTSKLGQTWVFNILIGNNGGSGTYTIWPEYQQ